MKILFIGDIYGHTGIKCVEDKLRNIIAENKIDLVIANGENSSKFGKSLIYEDYKKLKLAGVDFFTMGNHTFRNPKILDYIDNAKDLVRPLNWEGPNIPGKGTGTIKVKGKTIRITSLIGDTFMQEPNMNPYSTLESVLEYDESDIHIVDFHAEATSEKIVFGYKMDGKVSAILGTHTHVPTADFRINPKGTFYVTDVGMTGSQVSAIGSDLDSVAKKLITGLPSRFLEADTPAQFCSVIMEFDENNNPSGLKQLIINPK